MSGSTVNKEPAARLRSVSEAPVDKALTLWVDIVGCLIQMGDKQAAHVIRQSFP